MPEISSRIDPRYATAFETAIHAVCRAGRCALSFFVVLLAGSLNAWGATATTTALTAGSKTVNTRAITALTAKVTATGTTTVVTQGLVRFYDGKVLLGTGQIVNNGTKFTHGAAYLSAELAPGTHSLTAVFAGTATYATSTSAAAPVTIGGGTTSTTLSSSGAAGSYTLTGQVVASGTTPVTGSVNFIDQTNSNATVGSAVLGTATAKRTYAGFLAVSIYSPDPSGNDFPQQVVVADLNGDGISDIVDLEYSGKISVHLGNGDGTFHGVKSYCMDTSQTPAVPCTSASGGPSEPTSIAVGDFNSDGIPDLVFVDGSTAYISLGNGDGTFQKPVEYQTQGNNTIVQVADLNRDGTPDLVVSISDGVSILLGNGDGTFKPHYEVGLNDASTYITIGDFNKDGIPDIASAGWNGETLMVLLGNGDGTFQAEKDTPIDINPAGCTVAAADFKNSGFLADVALCGDGALEALVGKGDGTFAAPQALYPNGTFDEYANWVVPVDMNGDGNVDLVLAWDSSDTDVGRLGIFTGKGDGTFNTTPTTLTVGKEPVFVTSGYLSGSGTPDLVTANDTDNNLSLVLQKATSTATASLSNVSLPGTGDQSMVAEYSGDSHYATSTSSAITLTGSGGVAGPPAIASLSPTGLASGSGAFTLTVNGNNFATGAVVSWNGSARTTVFVSATKLNAAILATDVAAAGAYAVTVTVGTQVSNTVTFTVTQSSTGPTITALSPNYAYVNSPAITMTVTGSNFISGTTGSVVHFGTTALATTYVSATSLTAVIPAANLKALGTFTITVWNAAVSESNTTPFTVGPATHTPLAYGFFNKDGSAGGTSGNITCKWSSPEYLCTITGEDFYFTKYVVNATIGDSQLPGMIAINSIGGNVIVKIYNASSVAIQAPFYVVVYKP